MSFIIKCALFLGLAFLVVAWRGNDVAPPIGPATPRIAARDAEHAPRRTGDKRQETVKREASPPNALAALAREGVERLSQAAAERCVARPRDCLTAAELLLRAAPSSAASPERGAKSP